MKLLIFAIVFWFCCDFSYGLVFDPYTRRYNIRNASFDALFTPSPVASTAIQALVLASTKIDNDRCKSIHQFAIRPTLDQLVTFQYELIDLCPQLYETIRIKNITTWGPIDEFLQIWYMRFVDALWKRISLKELSGRCALYDDFIAAAENDLDVALFEYLENNYNPSLCEVNNETMREWHLFFQRTQVFNRLSKHLQIGGFSLQLVHAIAKAYLNEARYNAYLIGPPYPLITYMNASLSMPNFTLTQKSFFKQTFTALSTAFGPLDLAGRQNYFIMKFCEIIDLSWSYFGVFNMIPMDPLDGITHYHLILYYSRKNFLISKQLEYVAPPTVPTTAEPPLTCPTIPAPSPSTDPTCTAPPGTAGIFFGSGVTLGLLEWPLDSLGKVDPIETCNNSSNGYFAYYAGNTTVNWDNYQPVSAGYWNRSGCEARCVCTATSCYEPQIDPEFPEDGPLTHINLYPHCITASECFIAGIFFSDGYLVNPLNASDKYRMRNHLTEYDVTNISYPRITKIGCHGCPVISSPSTCSCPPTVLPTTTPTCDVAPPGSAKIFLENGVTLVERDNFPKTKPINTCVHDNGIMAYYNGSTPKNFTYHQQIWIGDFLRMEHYLDLEEVVCSSPCVCTDAACYVPETPEGFYPFFPYITLYPHCTTPNNCYVAAYLERGNLVNPLNASDKFEGYDLKPWNASTFDSTRPEWAKVTKIGCNGCPVIPSPSTCTCPKPTPICIAGTSPPMGTAEIFIGNNVVLEYDLFGIVDPVSTCLNPPNGFTAYYNGSTSLDADSTRRVWLGKWNLNTCSSPCLCTATACYTPVTKNAGYMPQIYFYPHCTAPNTCFVVPVLISGTIVNPLNETDKYDHEEVPDFIVTKPYMPKITKIGCEECPVVV